VQFVRSVDEDLAVDHLERQPLQVAPRLTTVDWRPPVPRRRACVDVEPPLMNWALEYVTTNQRGALKGVAQLRAGRGNGDE
jgi:hypothetical protein